MIHTISLNYFSKNLVSCFDKYCPEKSHWKREKIFTKTLDNQRNSKIYYIEN